MWYFVLKVKNEGNNKQVFNNQDVLLVLVDHLLNTKKEDKNLKKQEIQDKFIKTN